jgi:hypothetical protein
MSNRAGIEAESRQRIIAGFAFEAGRVSDPHA